MYEPGAAPFDQLHPVLQHHIVNTLGWRGLRPLQADAVAPVLRGDDCLLIAPTAGGKTEAAAFPLLTRMERERWPGLSVLYVCPLKALLNNLHPRLRSYTQWLGHEVSIRHGDTPAGIRKRQATHRPSMLLTTPESLEAMLVSTTIDPQHMFGDVQAVVIDEVHAFAGDDRGWHLLAVLERLTALTGRHIQRVGLSATVGNADGLLQWLQGSACDRPRSVVAPTVVGATKPDLTLDYVGNLSNAATVLSSMYQGEKRLVFADSRRSVEALALALRGNGIETFVSHSSLSLDERRRAEAAFAEAQDCVIVSTSTLELGIDVGDLDRVIQLGAPGTVASVLQRLGRSGRRAGTARNMLFLATEDEEFLRALGLLTLLGEGFVEPVQAPPAPRHVAAQQFLGAALQKGRILPSEESAWMATLGLASLEDLAATSEWLIETGHLDTDEGLAFIGPTAEQRFGRRNFMDLLAVFTAAPEVSIVHGRQEIGSVDPMVLVTKTPGPRVIALAGRAWEVTHVDWKRHRAYVEPSRQPGTSKWMGTARPYTHALSDAIRRVLLGADPTDTELTRRSTQRIDALRRQYCRRVDPGGTVVTADDGRMRWWTFAGRGANAVLVAALGAVDTRLLDEGTYNNLAINLRSDATAARVATALREARSRFGDDLATVHPEVSADALSRLKFSEMLPPALATRTLAERTADRNGAAEVMASMVV